MTRCFFFLLLIWQFPLLSQSSNQLDSLEQELAPFSVGDTLRFPILNELFNLTSYSDMERARKYARWTVQLGTAAKLPIYEGEGYQRLGIAFENDDLFDSAVYYYNKALDTYQQEEMAYAQGVTLYNMSIVYQREGKYDIAREKLQRAKELYAGLDLPIDQADILNVLAQIEREPGILKRG